MQPPDPAAHRAALPPVGRRRLLRTCLPQAGVLLLASCKLVDQRTFDPAAGRMPVPRGKPPPVRRPPAVPPLLVVRDPAGSDDWRPGLERAVRAALARKPNVLFTVQTTVPTAATPAAEAAALSAAGGTQGSLVANAIIADGARPAQVELSAAADPALHGPPEVRIFVQ